MYYVNNDFARKTKRNNKKHVNLWVQSFDVWHVGPYFSTKRTVCRSYCVVALMYIPHPKKKQMVRKRIYILVSNKNHVSHFRILLDLDLDQGLQQEVPTLSRPHPHRPIANISIPLVQSLIADMWTKIINTF